MEPDPSHSHDALELGPAQGFQSESAEHAAAEPPAPAGPPTSGPEAGYQHEDDEPIWPIPGVAASRGPRAGRPQQWAVERP